MIASDSADVKFHDLALQFMTESTPEYEFEPISFQASSMNYIPNEISRNPIDQSGLLVENIFYFV